uniref:Protein timeless homolog (Trinotate prediction) n=1 Tax=Henneguya salminicola TaxID=69463 RepID=A0A6G3MFB1_HENSL
MDSELLECASNLGFSESGIYYPGETCAESLNDLWSFLKRTDQTVERYISFYRSKIITDDIIPLICSQPEDDEIMFAQFQLLFLLTFPISRILIDEEINKEKFNMYLELMNLQLNMREEISNTEIFSAFKYYLKTFLQTSQDKNEYIEIILNIIINLFNEENSTRVCCSKNYSLIYEKLMRNFFTSHLSSIILFLTNSQGQILSSYYALAILFNVLKYIVILYYQLR